MQFSAILKVLLIAADYLIELLSDISQKAFHLNQENKIFMNMQSLSLKQKFTFALVAAVVISTLLVGGLGQYQTRALLADRVENVELPSVLTGIRNKIDREISLLEAASEQLANNALIEQWMLNGHPRGEEQPVVDLLKRLTEQHKLSNASVVHRESAYYWNQDGFLRQLKNDQHDGWFFAYRESGQRRSKSLYSEDDIPKLFMNYQDLDGVVATGIARTIDDFQDMLSRYKIGDSGYVYLTDASGMIQLHRDVALVGKKTLADRYGANNTSGMLSKQEFTLKTIDVDGTEHYVAVSYIENADWYLVAEVPVTELFAEVNGALIEIVLQIIGIGILAALAAPWFARRLIAPLVELSDTFEQLGTSEANLDVRLKAQNEKELVALQSGFNTFLDKIKETINQIASTSTDVMNVSHDVSELAENATRRGQVQSSHTEGVIHSIEELSDSVNRIASNASEAASTTAELTKTSKIGLQVSQQTKASITAMTEQAKAVSQSIQQLEKHTESIEDVLSVIKGVSEQTNLLALNAAIEAARAGEQGRGFAVVADEVRSLAQRTHDSTDEIDNTIKRLQEEVRTAVNLIAATQSKSAEGDQAVSKNEEVLVQMSQSMDTLLSMNQEIADTTDQQSKVTQSVLKDLAAIRTETEAFLSSSEAVSGSSKNLSMLSDKMDELVAQYR